MSKLYALSLSLLLLTLSASRSAAAPPDDPPEPRRPVQRLIERLTTLLPKDVADQLQLAEAQKKEVAKLQKQLDEKTRKVMAEVVGEFNNVQEAFDKARTDNNFDALKSMALALAANASDLMRVRRELDAKVRGLLDDDQKKLYDDLMKERERPRRRPLLRRDPNRVQRGGLSP